MNDIERAEKAEEFYVSYLAFAESLFKGLIERRELDYESVSKKVKAVSEYVLHDRHYLMQAKHIVGQTANENYHVAHLVRTSIIAMIIGTYLKLPHYKHIELGIAALLCDIGVLKLRPDIYMNNNTLTEQEKKLIHVHTIHAYKTLKSLNFPLSICDGVLEHHEREDGTGYPQNLTGEHICLYGKIIAVACSYEAFSIKSVEEEKCGHTGMLKLLKNEGNHFDKTIIRALVYSLSIFPVGLYVLMSDGAHGQVVEPDPENPHYPFVRLLDEPLLDGKIKPVRTCPDGLFIVRPLTREEVETVRV